MVEVAEALVTVQAAVYPGTDLRELAGRLADAISELPVPAVGALGPVEIPDHIAGKARRLGEKQGMATAAADMAMYVCRVWYQPDERFEPADWHEVALALRALWERMYGPRTGLADVTVFAIGLLATTDQWMTMAHECRWWEITENAPDGLIPVG